MSEIRDRLVAAGNLVGTPVTVDDGSEWTLSEHGVTVGLGFYLSRGLAEDEAVATALVDLWGSVRLARIAPVRVLRRSRLTEIRPELEPLLRVIDRCQAVGEVLVSYPAYRAPLEPRGDETSIDTLPLATQFVFALLNLQFADTRTVSLDRAVRAELDSLSTAAFRRVCAPDTSRTPLERFERALALLLPHYERLLDADRNRQGLTTPAPEAATAEASEQALDDRAPSSDPLDESANEEPTPAGDAAADDPATPPPDDAHSHDHSHDRSRTDLFDDVLPEPLSWDLLRDLAQHEMSPSETPPHQHAFPGESSPGEEVRGSIALEAYRRKVAEHAPHIEAMRDAWQRVITERVAATPALSRTPQPDGDLLDLTSLPNTVAQVIAGVTTPAAFRRRVTAKKRTDAPGNTDIVLLLDRSGSMHGSAARITADAALIMLEGLAAVERDIQQAEAQYGLDLELRIRSALIVFDAAAHTVKTLTSPLDDHTRQALYGAALDTGGSTNDGAALAAAAGQLGVTDVSAGRDGHRRRRIVIVVSDGGSNDLDAARGALALLRQAGIEVIGVGIGSDEILTRYAPASVRVDDLRTLPDVLLRLIEPTIQSQ